ncbi:hypothetical protein PR048_021665 [Dryococelus australis]|uniref:Uncharacterized protein n=1 Tax=Dryococelus australis TaxID=614101 RepID=A0ABQ9GYX4_9NEOP|nr:hypothetical protein PR048_021665 [Dryococelus australis]
MNCTQCSHNSHLAQPCRLQAITWYTAYRNIATCAANVASVVVMHMLQSTCTERGIMVITLQRMSFKGWINMHEKWDKYFLYGLSISEGNHIDAHHLS